MSLLNKINTFLENLNKKLDTKLDALRRDSYYLKYSKNPSHRFIWKTLFKEDNRLSFEPISARKKKTANTRAKNLVHVVNLVDPSRLKNKSLSNRIMWALDSMGSAKAEGVKRLGASTGGIKLPNWQPVRLKRSAASVFKSPKDFAFLKDLLDEAAKSIGADDLIFYSNLDCAIAPDTYQKLLQENADVTEFLRKDIDTPDGLEETWTAPFSVYEIGVDAFCIRKSVYLESREILPDCVIGEPHWDTVYSGILNKRYEVTQNTHDLYHIKHEQQWDDANLSKAGDHNKTLYEDALNYGLMEDALISVKAQTVVILFKSSLSNEDNDKWGQLIKQLGLFANRFETVFCEFTEGNSPLTPYINKTKYFPIFNTNEYTKKLNQTNAIINCLLHYFSNFKNIIILQEGIESININHLKSIQLELQNNKICKQKNVVALKSSEARQNELDFYEQNINIVSGDIRKISFINDNGLLELLHNYET